MKFSQYMQLQERVYDLDHEVDFIYDRFFKEWVDEFDPSDYVPSNFGVIDGTVFRRAIKSKDAKAADDIKPLNSITSWLSSGNVYRPKESVINVAPNDLALDALRQGYLNQMDPSSDQHRYLKNEITETRIKSSIRHELSHWINDALNNQHIEKRIRKAGKDTGRGKQFNKVMNKGKSRAHEFLTDYELDAQLHAIVQWRKDNPGQWERIELQKALKQMPFFFALETEVTKAEMKEWKRYMYTRLARENLLGRRMKQARSLDEDVREIAYDYINGGVTKHDTDSV